MKKVQEYIATEFEIKRFCRKCKIQKSFTEFHKSKHGFNGYTSVCKKCKQQIYLKTQGRTDLLPLWHGLSRTRFYRIWSSMKNRCENPQNNRYSRYGGRGILYDTTWGEFNNFCKDMSPGYEHNLQLDRVDNDKGYCKENCRWVTPKTQQNNRHNNRKILHNGVALTMKQWAEKLHINYHTLSTRLNRDKLSFYEAIKK